MDDRFIPLEFNPGEETIGLNEAIKERVSRISHVKAASEYFAHLLNDCVQRFSSFRLDQMEIHDPELREGLKFFATQSTTLVANPYLSLRNTSECSHLFPADIIFSGATARRIVATDTEVRVVDTNQRVKRFNGEEYAKHFDCIEGVAMLISFIPFAIRNLHIPSRFISTTKKAVIQFALETYKEQMLSSFQNTKNGKMFGVQEQGLMIRSDKVGGREPTDSLLPKPEELATILEDTEFPQSDNMARLFAEQGATFDQIFSADPNVRDNALIKTKGGDLIDAGQKVFDALVENIVDDFITTQQEDPDEFSDQGFDIRLIFSRIKKRREITLTSAQESLSVIKEDNARPCIIDGIHDIETGTWIEGIGLQNALAYLSCAGQDQTQMTSGSILKELTCIGETDPERLIYLLRQDIEERLASDYRDLRSKKEQAKNDADSLREESKASIINRRALREDMQKRIDEFNNLRIKLEDVKLSIETVTKTRSRLPLNQVEVRRLIDLARQSLQN